MLTIRDLTAHAKAVAEVIKTSIAAALSPLEKRLQKLESLFDSDFLKSDLCKSLTQQVLQNIKQPKDGEPGKDADPEHVKTLVAEAVAALPAAKDGEPGQSITVDDVRPVLAELVTAAVGALPKAQDGRSVTVDELQPLVKKLIDDAMAAIELPKNGEPGRDGAELEILPAIDAEKSYPRGTYATHNGGLWRSYQSTVGMKGWECIVDGIAAVGFDKLSDRKYCLQVTCSSEKSVSKEIYIPTMVYRGVFVPGEWEPGDTVTWNGALWHCDEPTTDKPGEVGSKGWTLAAKRGRDGKDGRNGIDKTKGVTAQ